MKRNSVSGSARAFYPTLQGARPLTKGHFTADPREVAPWLLGKLLVRRDGRKLIAGRIVELEAYLGVDDPAAHAAAGKTPRNAVLFGPPGHAYVYFIYGNHYCLNVSCMPEGHAGCLLFRALEPVAGIAAMAAARCVTYSEHVPMAQRKTLTSGPGRLAEALGITRARDNGKDLTDPASDLSIADDGYVPERIVTGPRIGITKAVDAPLRFAIAGNAFVSGRRIG